MTLPASSLTILSITDGNVLIKLAGTSEWIAATVGMTLQPGDSIKSGNNSNAEITFFEGSTIELQGSTEISLSEVGATGSGSTIINLKQTIGTTISRVKKLTDQDSEYEIETPAAIAAVRGSVMLVTVLEDGTTIVENHGGDIRVIAQGIEVIVPEGMRVIIIPGQPPGTPEPINPPTTTTTTTATGTNAPLSASINTGIEADPSEVYIGGTITYTYTISNTGNLYIRSVSISDSVTGVPVFSGGDNNTNSRLDPGETWIYIATHIASTSDPSPLVNTATFYATVSDQTTLSAVERASVLILPQIITESMPDGEVGAEYSQVLSVTGGKIPYSWSIVTGILPDGLTLNSKTGSITGTPTTAGATSFTVSVTDSLGSVTTKELFITVQESLTIKTETLQNATVGVTYSQTLVAVNGIPPYSWSIIGGALPDGLTLDAESGSISGVPTTAGSSTFTILVTDNLGMAVTKRFTITVS